MNPAMSAVSPGNWLRRWRLRRARSPEEALFPIEETPPSEVSIPQILQLLRSPRRADTDQALELIGSMERPSQRRQLRLRLLELLSKDYAPPRGNNEEPLEVQITRGWLLWALACASEQEPDAPTLATLERHLDRNYEPVDWNRFWALAGLHQAKHPQLTRIAQETLGDRTREPRNLVRDLALAILAAGGDGTWEQEIHDILRREVDQIMARQTRRQPGQELASVPALPAPPEKPEGAWEMIRALRVVPVTTSSIVNPLCDIIELGEYSGSTLEALLALGALRPQGMLAQRAVRALERYLSANPWPSHDSQRVAALRSLEKLGADAQRSTALLVEHLLDDNPSVVRAAACALEKILDTRRAVHRVLESCLEGRLMGRADQWGRALNWMNCKVVAETLDAVLASGSEEQQRWARDLLREVGGPLAFEKLHGRTAAMERYFDSLSALEEGLQDQLATSLREARFGFFIALLMDVVVFVGGLWLIHQSVRLALEARDLTALSGVLGAGGVVGVLYSVWIAKPRQQVRQAVDDLAHIKVVFLAYLRQLHQVDQAYTRRLLDSQSMDPSELANFRKMVSLTLDEALRHFRIGVARSATAPSAPPMTDEEPAPAKPRKPPSAENASAPIVH